MANAAMADMMEWLRAGGEVAILDGTNTTRERRQVIRDCVQDGQGYGVLWIESICRNKKIIERSIRETKLNSPDYQGWEEERATADFKQRILEYEKVYEPVSEADGPHIKIVDAGIEIVLHRVAGALPSKLAAFVTNLRPMNAVSIYVSRHGESMFNVLGLIGGDPGLSDEGQQYALKLNEWVTEHCAKTKADDASADLLHGGGEPASPSASTLMKVWYSPMRRAKETANAVGGPYIDRKVEYR
jgi:hypothetical protein